MTTERRLAITPGEAQAKGEPMVSDGLIAKRVEEYIEPYRQEITRVSTEVRDTYEAELARLRAERDEAMGLLRAVLAGQDPNNGLWHTMIHIEEFLFKHKPQ